MNATIELQIDSEQRRRERTASRVLLRVRAALLAFPILLLAAPSRSAFLDAGFGVRPEGMGGAFVAVADDANCIAYNPAGSVRVKQSEVSFAYSRPFAGLGKEVDLGLFYASYVRSFNNRIGTGLAWSQLNSPNLKENVLSLNLALNSGEIFHFGRDLSLGLNIKRMGRSFSLDQRTVGDPVFQGGDGKNVYAFDFGTWARPLPEYLPEVTAGFVLKNLNQPDAGLRTEDPVYLESAFGLGYQKKNLLFTAEASQRNGRQTIRGGAEAWFMNNKVGARAGGSSSGGSLGMSYRHPFGSFSLVLDYAFLMPFQVQQSAGTHRVSFGLHR